MIKIALAQINSCVADLAGNTVKIIANIDKARKKGVEIIVFPELALTGYPPEDLLLKSHFIEKNKQYLKTITKAAKDIIALVGFVDSSGSKIYNAGALLQDGKLIDVYHKIQLPNYGVFDEKRYFTCGESLSIFEVKGYRFSVSICEDIWEQAGIELLKNKKIDFVVNIAASPFHLGKVRLRERILSGAARQIQASILYCNLVGGQDELIFDGTSKVFSSDGRLIKCARRFEEDLLEFNFGREKKYPACPVNIREEEEAFSALCLGLYDYVNKNGFNQVILGVSGGIDSAVALGLAVKSLDKNNVRALIMPSEYTSQETFTDAVKLCRNFGVKYFIVRIDEILKVYLKILAASFKGRKPDKTEENLQARIRGNILMAFSNKFGYLVLNTGNKSEVSCGYCTLYGDMVGGFGVLKDVPKMLVYKLADYINKIFRKKVIPAAVIKRPPSAELKPNQKDIDSLPEYNLLDPILKLYVEEDCCLDEIAARGFDKSLAARVIQMVDANEYKRRQAPPGIKITPRAFGKDRRMPITNRLSVMGINLCNQVIALLCASAVFCGTASALDLSSAAFKDKGNIPAEYTCDTCDISPDLSWDNAPSGTRSFVLICDDPDAPFKTWLHWVVYNIAPQVNNLPQNLAKEKVLTDGIVQGINDFGKIGYNGPCPPPGKPHHYLFKLYALSAALAFPEDKDVTKTDIIAAMEGYILAETKIVGIYER